MQYIITVKLRNRHLNHDPNNKINGPCPYSSHCTDVTGQHHSFLGTDKDLEDLKQNKVHVTRVEEVS